MTLRTPRRLAAAALALLLVACNGPDASPPVAPLASEVPGANSSGQVAPRPAQVRVGFYAASRFAEQASFGPTPALVAEIQAKGFERWIDEQVALPPSQIDLAPFLVNPVPPEDWERHQFALSELGLTAGDQLRHRVAWALMQFISIDSDWGDALGRVTFHNMMLRRSLDRFGELLYDVATHPLTGEAFGVRMNRPRLPEVPNQGPNEHFARVLLEQYVLGPELLRDDATPQRDARGRPLPSYTQRDVEDLTRVLMGWSFDPDYGGVARLPRDWGNWRKPMVASTFPGDRDFASKRLLGSTLPEFQTAQEDLRQAIDILTGHGNAAPYLALRLIQSLVKSNPSADYLRRVAAVVRDNGRGVRGDMKAVVKAVLLDAEARAADDPLRARPDDGRLREPYLNAMAFYRAMQCQRFARNNNGNVIFPGHQRAFASGARGSYPPDHRAAQSHLRAPEQRLLNAEEFSGNRQSIATWLFRYDSAGRPDPAPGNAAGCNLSDLDRHARSQSDYLRWIGERFFRGTLPAALRQNLEQLGRQTPWNASYALNAPISLLNFSLMWPQWGVIE